MITEQKKRRFLPYLIAGLVFSYLAHWLVKLYDIAPATQGAIIFDNARLDWMLENWSSKSLIDFNFTVVSLYGAVVAFVIFMIFYKTIGEKGRYR